MVVPAAPSHARSRRAPGTSSPTRASSPWTFRATRPRTGSTSSRSASTSAASPFRSSSKWTWTDQHPDGIRRDPLELRPAALPGRLQRGVRDRRHRQHLQVPARPVPVREPRPADPGGLPGRGSAGRSADRFLHRQHHHRQCSRPTCGTGSSPTLTRASGSSTATPRSSRLTSSPQAFRGRLSQVSAG